ncbi:alpha/beta hydrolase [Nocardiopsis sp. CC223A]|uniref:alpha/beta hydrolase n=1 Tax=Nocardiopsis sp. CC223A TaxID=3044051 RepID=UPI00278C3E65|nr:alpha/beta hydrolase [Nocardiopsis sp. CC223A]
MSPARGAPRRRAFIAIAVVLALLAAAVGGFAAWGLNAYRAEPGPLGQALALPEVRIDIADDAVVLTPADGGDGTGVVFYPGARVEAEAYAAPWAPIVRDAGVTVVIPRMPLNFAVLAPGRADTAAAAHGEGVDHWYLGGHSLGGAMAAAHAGGDPDLSLAGLVLWGSYATEGAGLADRDDLRVLSVSGGQDALSDPETIDAARPHLPPDTEPVEIDGMNHAQFGAYGDQSGDGTARITDADAHRVLAGAVTAFLTQD